MENSVHAKAAAADFGDELVAFDEREDIALFLLRHCLFPRLSNLYYFLLSRVAYASTEVVAAVVVVVVVVVVSGEEGGSLKGQRKDVTRIRAGAL